MDGTLDQNGQCIGLGLFAERSQEHKIVVMVVLTLSLVVTFDAVWLADVSFVSQIMHT